MELKNINQIKKCIVCYKCIWMCVTLVHIYNNIKDKFGVFVQKANDGHTFEYQ